ncbi:hypothetical protein [Haloferula sp. A504]|uniref:hypothetical protein n=1 Tax=Haloferula sp. A504 TaxID=3373601 RepID=UPI0031C8D483|nr:hypothetical protein [Verrucomicrobiaceae bacterium E54]
MKFFVIMLLVSTGVLKAQGGLVAKPLWWYDIAYLSDIVLIGEATNFEEALECAPEVDGKVVRGTLDIHPEKLLHFTPQATSVGELIKIKGRSATFGTNSFEVVDKSRIIDKEEVSPRVELKRKRIFVLRYAYRQDGSSFELLHCIELKSLREVKDAIRFRGAYWHQILNLDNLSE